MAAAAFAALNFYRLIQLDEDNPGWDTLVLALGVFAFVWLALWGITRVVERHRRLHPAPPSEPEQRPRWRL